MDDVKRETPSGPPCPCGYDDSLGTMVEEAAHRSDCPKAKGETPRAPSGKCPACGSSYPEMRQCLCTNRPHDMLTCLGLCSNPWHKGETPSALSAASEFDQWMNEQIASGNVHESARDSQFLLEVFSAGAATLRERIKELEAQLGKQK